MRCLDSIYCVEEFFDRRPVRRVLAAVREKDCAVAIQQKIPTCLIVVVFTVVLKFHSFAQQF